VTLKKKKEKKKGSMWITWQRIAKNCHKDAQRAQKNKSWTNWEFQQRENI